MSNSQQKEIQDNFISERISKWVNAHQRNTSKKKRQSKLRGFSQTKRIENIVKNIMQIKKSTNLLENKLEQFKRKTRFIGKKTELIGKMTRANRKNAESFTK